MREDATFQILAKHLTDIRLWVVVVALAMGGLLKWVRATVVYSKNPADAQKSGVMLAEFGHS